MVGWLDRWLMELKGVDTKLQSVKRSVAKRSEMYSKDRQCRISQAFRLGLGLDFRLGLDLCL